MQLTFHPPEKTTSASKPVTKPRRSDRIRDHLANERTYLAWMRSAIALMGFGIVIVRMKMLQPPLMPSTGISWKLGLTFAVMGLLTVWLSTQHYFGVQRQIDLDTYEPSSRWVMLFSLAILLLGTGIIYYIFAAPAQLLTGGIFE